MKNKIPYLFRVVFLFTLIFLFPDVSHAYSVETHALLTKEAAEFLNSKYANKISEEQIRYLIDGSRREDDAPRWLSHFYDPAYNRGLSYDLAIDPGFTILQIIGSQSSSKDWALNGSLQKSFLYRIASKIPSSAVASILTADEIKNIRSLNDDVDFSWDRALKLYISGDKEGAMFTLGHVIHLIQDASVPDHTRNDPHTGDSPYENYTSAFNLNNPDNDLKSRLTRETPVNLNYLNNGFDTVSEYSNKNFYSENTIGIQSGYSWPQPDFDQREGDYIYSVRELNGDLYKLSLKKRIGIFGGVVASSVSLSADDSEELVLKDYWTRLSTKSVVYGASVIDLFFREAERLKDDPEFNKENKSFIAKIAEGIKNAFINMFNPPDDSLIAEIPADDNEPEDKNETTKPFVFVDKTGVYPGETIVESGSGFSRNSEVNLFFLVPSGKTTSVSITTDQNGQFNHAYTVHSSAETGVHYYWAEDKSTGLITDKVKYLIVPLSEEKSALEETVGINDQPSNKDREDSEGQSLILPNECSFSASGVATGGKQIVLNEIAWMGSTESSNGEWIELKNLSSSEVDISGWWLIDQAEQIRVVFPNNTKIPADRFYLLERGDDDAIPDVKADLIYTGTLSNTKEGLRLLNPNCLIEDEVSASPDWPAGDSAGRKPMERKADYSGWQTSSFVDGTPKQENSGGITVQGDNKNKNEFISPGGSASVSYCPQTGLSSPSNEILINEVAWAGDAESSSNEWMELYNPGEVEISLSGWQLLDKSENIKIVFDSGDKIPAKGYLLIIRGSDNFIPGIIADKFYSGSINNSDETLRLFNSSCALVDEIKDTGSNWKNIGGSASPDYKTAERLADSSWYSFSGPSGMIMGTPKAANSPKVIGAEDDEEGENDEGEDDGSESSWGSSANGVVISEIMPGLDGNPDSEFVELYNPTENDISLDGWYLTKKATISSEPVSLVSKSSELLNGKIILPKSFFLIASQSYSGNRTPDIIYSQSSSHLANNGDIIVFYNYQDEPALVTEYESVETGKSLERKAFAEGVCFQSTEEYEFSGNGCIADNAVVWNVRDNPNPQNLASLPEPRNKPVWPFTASDISSLYNSEKIAIDITWPSFIGTAKISNDNEVLWSGSGIEGKNRIKIQELGKEQSIYFEIVDEDGLASAEKASFSIIAPRLITDYKLYTGLKYDFDEQEEERSVIEFSWESFPFVPQDIGLALPYGEPPGPNFKVMVFYKNMDVPDDEFLYYEYPQPEYADSAVEVCYRDENYYDCRKRVIFSDSGSMEYYPGVPFSQQIRPDFYLTEGDNHLVLPVNNIQPGDYLTVGYYAFYRSYPSGTAEEESSKSFILVAKDNNRITFGSAPIHNPPTAPANLRSETQVKDGGEGLSTRLLTFWDDALDSDTPDRLMRYEVSYDSGATWNRAYSGDKIPVIPGETYTVQVRAVDDFGLYSEISETSTTIPPISLIIPEDEEYPEKSGEE